MSVRKVLKEINQHYCDGCGRPLGCESIYGYGTAIELGDCCHRELREFEHYKMRVAYAVAMIKAQPYFAKHVEIPEEL